MNNMEEFEQHFQDDTIQPEHIEALAKGLEDDKKDFKSSLDCLENDLEKAAECLATSISCGNTRYIIVGVSEDKIHHKFNVDPIKMSPDTITSKLRGALLRQGKRFEGKDYDGNGFRGKKHYLYHIVQYTDYAPSRYVLVVKSIYNGPRLARRESKPGDMPIKVSFPYCDGSDTSYNSFTDVSVGLYQKGYADAQVGMLERVGPILEKYGELLMERLSSNGKVGLPPGSNNYLSWKGYNGNDTCLTIRSIPCTERSLKISDLEYKCHPDQCLYNWGFANIFGKTENVRGCQKCFITRGPNLRIDLYETGRLEFSLRSPQNRNTIQYSDKSIVHTQCLPDYPFGGTCDLYKIYHLINYVLRMGYEIDMIAETNGKRVLEIEFSIPLMKDGIQHRLRIEAECISGRFYVPFDSFLSIVTESCVVTSRVSYDLLVKDDKQIKSIISQGFIGLDKYFEPIGGGGSGVSMGNLQLISLMEFRD